MQAGMKEEIRSAYLAVRLRALTSTLGSKLTLVYLLIFM